MSKKKRAKKTILSFVLNWMFGILLLWSGIGTIILGSSSGDGAYVVVGILIISCSAMIFVHSIRPSYV